MVDSFDLYDACFIDFNNFYDDLAKHANYPGPLRDSLHGYEITIDKNLFFECALHLINNTCLELDFKVKAFQSNVDILVAIIEYERLMPRIDALAENRPDDKIELTALLERLHQILAA